MDCSPPGSSVQGIFQARVLEWGVIAFSYIILVVIKFYSPEFEPVGTDPWDSQGKNTGVGCHFRLQCVKVKSESKDAQSCPTLSNPIDCSLPDSSAHGIFQARVLEWVAIAFSDQNGCHLLNVMNLCCL